MTQRTNIDKDILKSLAFAKNVNKEEYQTSFYHATMERYIKALEILLRSDSLCDVNDANCLIPVRPIYKIEETMQLSYYRSSLEISKWILERNMSFITN